MTRTGSIWGDHHGDQQGELMATLTEGMFNRRAALADQLHRRRAMPQNSDDLVDPGNRRELKSFAAELSC